MESYRIPDNRLCHRTILNVGFMEDTTPEQLNRIKKHRTDKYEQKTALFNQEDDSEVKPYVEDFWQSTLYSKKLDIKSVDKLSRMVNLDTL